MARDCIRLAHINSPRGRGGVAAALRTAAQIRPIYQQHILKGPMLAEIQTCWYPSSDFILRAREKMSIRPSV